MKTSIFTFLLVLAYFFTSNTVIFTQDKPEKTIETIYQKGTGDDANVISKDKKNDPNDKSQIPAWKDESSKGPGYDPCEVTLKNYTSWYIDIYIDGYYQGTIGPWEDRYTYTGTGTTKLYAKAEMNDGSYLYWGPQSFYCDYRYTWKFNKK